MTARATTQHDARRTTVLIVDDDAKVVATIARYVEHSGMTPVTAANGLDALARVRESHPDLIVLDRMLPGLDGMGVCRVLRSESSIPIIMLTARAAEHERLEGLELGADDYVVKPFSPRELMARIRAVLRRTTPPAPNAVIRVASLEIDLTRHEARLAGVVIPLTATELRLLSILARAPARVFSRSELMEQLFGWDHEGAERGVDAHIKNLRRKIEPGADRPAIIETVFGVGYRLSRAGLEHSDHKR